MKVSVIYPVPLESDEVWQIFRPAVQRFCLTWRLFPPGVRCGINVMCCGNEPDSEVKELFDGLPAQFCQCDALGADLGAQQFCAKLSDTGVFQVNFTSRMYFHRSGWLARLVSARNSFGPALYGLSASMEGGKFHLCTRGHCYDTDDFKLYPHDIVSRNQGVFFECGQGCLLDWFKSIGRDTYVVTWDYAVTCSPGDRIPNGFRDGTQEQMLAWDKHTKIYADASPEEKERLESLAFGLANPVCPS